MAILGALLRRIGVYAGTALIVQISDGWTDWVMRAVKEEPKLLIWIPIIALTLETLQKTLREWLKSRNLASGRTQ